MCSTTVLVILRGVLQHISINFEDRVFMRYEAQNGDANKRNMIEK